VALDILAITDAIVTPLLASGEFARVNQHEPKTAPGSGVTAAVWFTGIWPFAGDSGLSITSAVVVYNIRLYTSMLAEPQDAIDPEMQRVASTVITLFSADFELGGSVRNVDIFGEGAHGELSAQSGYINQDGRLLRIIDITLPLVINDVWPQTP
jgi:hypothetical protein